MKKENRFIICICLFIVLSYIIIAIFYNNLSKFYKKEKITNDVMGVILEKNKEHFTLKPFYNEDENKRLVCNQKILNLLNIDMINSIEICSNDFYYKDDIIFLRHKPI